MARHFVTAWRLGVRSRSFFALVLVSLLALIAALLASQFSGRQPATVAMDVAISAIRLIGVLLALFWTQELFARDIERRHLHTILSYPVPRSHYVIGRFLGVGLLLLAAVAIFGLLLGGLVWWVGLGYNQPTPVNNGMALVPVLGYLWLDLLTVTAFAWLIASLATTPFLPFALGLAFAWVAHSLAPTLAYLEAGKAGMERLQGEFHPLLSGALWLLPDLSRLDIRPAVLYGAWPDPAVLALAPLNAGAYTALLLGLAVWRFQNREFA